jgi:hypothetical protein
MIKLTEADRILKEAYVSLLNEEIKKPSGKKMVCAKCHSGSKTLRKYGDGYICNECYKEIEE